jgi:transposase
MSKTRQPYPEEFRQKMVELVRSGRSPKDLAKEYEPSALSIRYWVAKADGVPVKSKTIPSEEEQKELERLRKEVRILREERDILKKAAAWFAQEIGTPSSKRSSS